MAMAMAMAALASTLRAGWGLAVWARQQGGCKLERLAMMMGRSRIRCDKAIACRGLRDSPGSAGTSRARLVLGRPPPTCALQFRLLRLSLVMDSLQNKQKIGKYMYSVHTRKSIHSVRLMPAPFQSNAMHAPFRTTRVWPTQNMHKRKRPPSGPKTPRRRAPGPCT